MRILILIFMAAALGATFACGELFNNSEEDSEDSETSQTQDTQEHTGCEWLVAESYPEQLTGECKYALGTSTTFAITLNEIPPNESTLRVLIDGEELANDAMTYDRLTNVLTLRLAGGYSGVNQVQIRYTATTENRG